MLSDSERAFMSAGRASGYSDDELVAKVKERRAQAPGSYKLTDYAGEAAKLPPANLTEAEKAGIPAVADDSGENVITRMLHRALPETRQYRSREPGHTGETVPAPDDVFARDPMASMILASQLGGGAGALAKGLGPVLAGAANGATQSAVLGGRGGDIVEGGAMGAAVPALGAIAKRVGNAVTDSAGGRARALWESHGGNVGPLDSGSGVAPIEGMEPTRRNVGIAGRLGAKGIKDSLAQRFEETTGEPYRAARAAVESPSIPDELIDEPTRQIPRETMQQVVGEDRAGSLARGSSDLSIHDAGNVPADKLRDISALRGVIADHLYSEKTPTAARGYLRNELDRLDDLRSPDGRVMVTERALNDMRERLNTDARYGIPIGGPGTGNLKVQAMRDIAKTAQELTNEGPYAEANAVYRKGMGELEKDRRLMSAAGEDAIPDPSTKQVGQWIRNRSNDSEAAGGMYKPGSHEAFLERHPELRLEMDLPDLLKAKEKLQFSLGGGGATDNLIQATARKSHGFVKKAIEPMVHNANAIAGRLAYTPAGALADAGQAAQSPMLTKLMAALAAQRQLEDDRAQALGR